MVNFVAQLAWTMIHTIRSLAFLLLLISSISSGVARVIDVDIRSRDTVLNGKHWGPSGPYELIQGTVQFGTDPFNDHNQQIVDIHLAPTNEQGWVISSADLVVLKPVDPTKSTVALIEVTNRGGMFTPSYFLAGQGKVSDPDAAMAFGDGLLLRQGYTIIWVGWQFDVPEREDLLNFFAPVAKYPEGSPIIGLARSDWTLDEPTHNLKLGHRDQIGYPAYDLASDVHRLTKRPGRDAARITVDRADWEFGKLEEDRILASDRWIYSQEGFEAGMIYELVYHTYDPVVVGLGLSAIRDMASFVKYDTLCPFGASYVLAAGVSQTGRFLRHFLYQGFNADEAGRRAYDGMMIITAGAGRGSFNHRFAQPSRDAHRYSAFFYPTDIFPFTSRTQEDPVTGIEDGLLAYVEEEHRPKIFYVNTGYEYWGRAAGLIHTSPDGRRDISPLDHERIYHIASGQHFVNGFPPANPEGPLHIGNPLQFKPNYRALLSALTEWVVQRRDPPASQIPTIREGSLVSIDRVNYPSIPGFEAPQVIHQAYRADYGPNWSRGLITRQPPHLPSTFPSLAPQVDNIGNEIGGIRNVEIRVPLATYVPTSVRTGMAGGNGELHDFRGTYIPLPLVPTSADDRPAISELYTSKEAYLDAVGHALDELVQDRFVLQDDTYAILRRSSDYWNWIHRKEATRTASINVMSFNIRYDNPRDGPHRWDERKERVSEIISTHQPAVLGLQEALRHQCQYLAKNVKGYRWVGVGRDDGKTAGEYVPIFYLKKKWKLRDWGTFWLSETPDQVSKGWDAALERIVTWARLVDRATGKELFAFNTHFDHRGKQARIESARLLARQIAALAGDAPFVVMGDFNFSPTTIAYRELAKDPLVDARVVGLHQQGPQGTFSGFTVKDELPRDQIDYIFLRKGLSCTSFQVIDQAWNGHYASDHFAVMAQVQF